MQLDWQDMKLKVWGLMRKKYRHEKEYLLQEILNYYDKYKQVPTYREFDAHQGYIASKLVSEAFGSWNNALLKLGFELNSVSQYDDDFLESEFHRFVEQNGRVPSVHEFNNSEYPSFWCYQQRFGSWNKAVINYGYEINDSNVKTTLEDGEICASSYELKISNWLKNNNIKYDRNIKYKDFVDSYKGKMDCDYKIYYNDKIYFIEMAGFINKKKNKSDIEKRYLIRLSEKEELLKKSKVNYKIIKRYEIEDNSLDDIFSFIHT